MKYNTHNVVNVFRSIATLVHSSPELLNYEGAFRLSGSHANTEKLIAQLIEHHYDWKILRDHVTRKDQIASHTMNDVLSLCNHVLHKVLLLEASDPLLEHFSEELRNVFQSAIADETKSIQAAALFDGFINRLLLSESIIHQRIGEIIYHYCYLMHTTATYAKTNQMSSRNLATILAPHFISEIELFDSDDLVRLTQFTTGILIPMLEEYIASNLCEHHFMICHSDKIERLITSRIMTQNKLHQMQQDTDHILGDRMRGNICHSVSLAHSINEIKEQLKRKPLTKESKNTLKMQRKQLKAALAEHERIIIELDIDLSAAHARHSDFFEERNQLTRSIECLRTPIQTHASSSSGQLSMFASSATIEPRADEDSCDDEDKNHCAAASSSCF